MKKYLLLLPLAGLLLTGCGEKPVDNPATKEDQKVLPSGGESVDINNEEKVNGSIDKLVKNLKTSYNSIKDGIELSGNLVLNELELINRSYTAKVTNTGFDYSIKAKNLDKKISEWEIAVNISNFHGYSLINADDAARRKEFSASNISFAAYLSEGKIYTDLSDAALPALVNSILAYTVPSDSLSMAQQFAAGLLGKRCLGSIIELAQIPDAAVLPVLKDSDFESLKPTVAGAIGEAKALEKNPLTILDYPNDGLGVEVSLEQNFTTDHLSMIDVESQKYLVNVLFGENGKLARGYLKEEISSVTEASGRVISSTKVNVEGTISVKFGALGTILPDFSEYVLFDISPLFEIVNEKPTPMPVPTPLPKETPEVIY